MLTMGLVSLYSSASGSLLRTRNTLLTPLQHAARLKGGRRREKCPMRFVSDQICTSMQNSFFLLLTCHPTPAPHLEQALDSTPHTHPAPCACPPHTALWVQQACTQTPNTYTTRL